MKRPTVEHPFSVFRDQRISFHSQGALGAARRYAEDLERGRVRVAEAERERLRVRAATETLLERVNGLARKAEEEATEVHMDIHMYIIRFRYVEVRFVLQSAARGGAAHGVSVDVF